MGMFDYLRCEYDLPIHDAPAEGWQTKSTPAQAMDVYTIRKDGTLWGQEYDIEDRSNPNAKGLNRIRGMATRVNHRDVRCTMTGEVRFYTSKDGDWGRGWIEISAYFVNGQIKHLEVIENLDA